MRTPFIFLLLTALLSCQGSGDRTPEENAEGEKPLLSFRSYRIADDANLWWARTLADVDGDGVLDVALQDNNGAGGWLGYLKGTLDQTLWEPVVVAETSPNGNPFAAGDLATGDLDGDGDLDLIGIEHPGEWTDSDAPAHLFMYEQSAEGWSAHPIGTIPSALKDISVADLDADGLPEIVTVTFNAATLSIFTSGGDRSFRQVQAIELHHLHEGLDVGDLDGDGRTDIATNGYWLRNPGDLAGAWEVGTIDSIWFDQEGDWSANATKVAVGNVDGDAAEEVFITHSERAGYPVARYDLESDGSWSKHILMDSLHAAHSLVLADMDLDGDLDLLTGVNRHRAEDIDRVDFPVYLLYQEAEGWRRQRINDEGVYNLLAGDLEGDGDIDLVRLTTHDGNEMDVMVNTLR